MTPYYNKPPQEGSLAHFRAIADATDLPVMLYDIPGRTATKISADTLARLSEHPRIVAVKDATGDLYAGAWLLRSTDLAIYSGDDAVNFPWLALGAVGVVSVVGHLAGRRYADMIAAIDAGDLDTARKIDRSILPAVRAIMTRDAGRDHGQGGPRAAGRAAPTGWSGCRWCRPPPSRWRSSAPTSRAPSSRRLTTYCTTRSTTGRFLDEPPAP